jgi:hypothetical protein
VGSRIFLGCDGEGAHSLCSIFCLLQTCSITSTSSLSNNLLYAVSDQFTVAKFIYNCASTNNIIACLHKYSIYEFLFFFTFFSCMNLFVNKTELYKHTIHASLSTRWMRF